MTVGRAARRAFELAILTALFANPARAGEARYSIRDVVDSIDGGTVVTREIQTLIDKVSAGGGGYVYFPPGDYLTGTIELKDNTYLELAPGATLYGSKEIEDYRKDGDNDYLSLIYANGATNIGIVGKGTIDGNGEVFWRGKQRPLIRPSRFILIENSENVRFEDIHILNSPSWNMELRFCDWVWVDGITMISDLESLNSDGIDPVSCSNVFISNCYISVGDDAICPKANEGAPTENLVVTNCVLISDDTAIKLGTRSDDHIRNATFSNIVIRNSVYGLAFYAKDGGTYENIRFDNIHVETPAKIPENYNVGAEQECFPIYIDLERRTPESKLGKVRNVYFSDITIDSPDGINLFLGQPDSPLENIHLSNIHYTLHHRRSFEGNKKPRGTRSLTDKAPNDFSHIPAHFIFAHIDGLHIDQLKLTDLDSGADHERRMIWANDVRNVIVSDFSNRLAAPNQALPQFHFKDSSNIELKMNSPAATSTEFLYLEGARTSNVVVHNNNFTNIGTVVELHESVVPSELIDANNIRRP